jgi:Exonuclease III
MGNILKELNVIHINIQGIKTSRTELELLITDLQPHIITINETHLKPKDQLSIPNYNVIRKDRRNGRGGGVAILYNRQLPVSQVDLPKQYDAHEALLAKVHIPNWPIHISTIYNPPETPIPNDLIHHLATIHKSILLSDLNAHHPTLGDNPSNTNRQGRALATLLERSNFRNIILPGPTRFPQTNNQSFTSPDKILATHPVHNRINLIQIHEPPNSDHAPIQILLKTPYWRPIKIGTRQIQDYSNADWTKFQDLIAKQLPNINPTNKQDIDMYDQALVQTIQTATTKSIPNKTITTNTIKQRCRLPDYVIKIIKVKRRAHRLYIKTKTDSNKKLYRRMQEDVKAAISLHEKIKYEQLTRKLNTDWNENPKIFWQTINNLRSAKTYTRHPLQVDNRIIINDKEKAELFGTLLQEIYRVPRSAKFNNEHLQETETFVQNHPFLFKSQNFPPNNTLISTDEVALALNKLKNTAPGPDGIQNIIWKHFPITALTHLAKLFSASLHFGHIPQRWKEAHILMIPKPNKNPGDPNSYRPISLTNTISKLMEKIIVRKYNPLIQKVLPPSQAGFRPGMEITDQLLRVLTPIEHSLHNRGFTTIIAALDIQKAFDTMWHDGLRLKMTKLNFPINFIRWISNFLTNRTARVKINDTMSPTINLEAGAPQGSTISPTLYNIYVHDIPQPTDSSTGLAQFADDTCMWAIAPRIDQASKRLNNYVKTYTDWTSLWRITINADKTQTMVVRKQHKRKRLLERNPIKINNKPVPYTDKIQYLGITITNKLSLTQHITKIIKRVYPAIRMLHYLNRKNTHIIKQTRINIYKTLIRSSLTYAAPLLLNTTKTNKRKLDTIHRKSIRSCLQLPRSAPNIILTPLSGTSDLTSYIKEISRRYRTRALSRNIANTIRSAPSNTTANKLMSI